MATKKAISRLGTTPARQVRLREDHIEARARAFGLLVAALTDLTTDERTQCLAAAAEFYGLTLVVEN